MLVSQNFARTPAIRGPQPIDGYLVRLGSDLFTVDRDQVDKYMVTAVGSGQRLPEQGYLQFLTSGIRLGFKIIAETIDPFSESDRFEILTDVHMKLFL